mmetsp:Transcript_16751/g.38776  ORF Transcript_16751/g.38776 Transcript_16751/m.38776 type:complete len:348 (-) Transcript_16751:414-1457(-)
MVSEEMSITARSPPCAGSAPSVRSTASPSSACSSRCASWSARACFLSWARYFCPRTRSSASDGRSRRLATRRACSEFTPLSPELPPKPSFPPWRCITMDGKAVSAWLEEDEDEDEAAVAAGPSEEWAFGKPSLGPGRPAAVRPPGAVRPGAVRPGAAGRCVWPSSSRYCVAKAAWVPRAAEPSCGGCLGSKRHASISSWIAAFLSCSCSSRAMNLASSCASSASAAAMVARLRGVLSHPWYLRPKQIPRNFFVMRIRSHFRRFDKKALRVVPSGMVMSPWVKCCTRTRVYSSSSMVHLPLRSPPHDPSVSSCSGPATDSPPGPSPSGPPRSLCSSCPWPCPGCPSGW